mgnify:CR=1 FL=1
MNQVIQISKALLYHRQWLDSKQSGRGTILRYEDIIRYIKGKVLKEETKLNMHLRRRLDMLDYEIESRMDGKKSIYTPENICKFESDEEFLEVIMEYAIDSMYHTYFNNLDDNSGEWPEIYYDMVKYVRHKYGEQIKSYYNENCGSKKNEMREGELSEKCWPGYTQKGMKTMFGKRYPNCVKKTKK